MSSEVLSQISDRLRERLKAKVSRQRRDGEVDSIFVRCQRTPETKIEHLPVVPDQTFFSHERMDSVLHVTTTMPRRVVSSLPASVLICPAALSMVTLRDSRFR